MGSGVDQRSGARRLAVQALYQMELAGASAEEAISAALVLVETEDFPPENALVPEDREPTEASETRRATPVPLTGEAALALGLALEVARNRATIDEKIDSAGARWRLDRMARMDAQVLRLAVAEMMGTEAPPVAVIIDEAIRLARDFCGDDSPKFVNGVLDAVARAMAEQATTDKEVPRRSSVEVGDRERFRF